MVRGTKQLKPPFDDETLMYAALHEFGHAVDDVMLLSFNPEFVRIHKLDVQALSPDDAEQYAYFVKPMEACAEITGGMIGNNQKYPSTEAVIRLFPRCYVWLKQRLKL